MKILDVTLYPYATVHATLEVPDNLQEKYFDQYLEEHFNDLRMDEPILDFKGIVYDIEEER